MGYPCWQLATECGRPVKCLAFTKDFTGRTHPPTCSVVDSTDTERLEIARAELHAMLEESDLDGVILLVFANKQDMKGALNAAQIGDALGLASIKDRPWSIQETSALAGRGLTEGFDWLVGAINSSGKA